MDGQQRSRRRSRVTRANGSNTSSSRRNNYGSSRNRKRKTRSSDEYVQGLTHSDSSELSSRPKRRKNTRTVSSRSHSRVAESGSSNECFPAIDRRRRRNLIPSDDSDSDSSYRPSPVSKRNLRSLESESSSSSSECSDCLFENYFDSDSENSRSSDMENYTSRTRTRLCTRNRGRGRILRRRNNTSRRTTSTRQVSPLNMRLMPTRTLSRRTYTALGRALRYRSPTPGPSSRAPVAADSSSEEELPLYQRRRNETAVIGTNSSTLGRVLLTIHGPAVHHIEVTQVGPQRHVVEELSGTDTDPGESTAIEANINLDPSGYASSDGESDKCPICLIKFVQQEVGVPGCCDHNFCATCIIKWADSSTTCPVDRLTFTSVTVRRKYGGKPLRKLHFQARTLPAGNADVQYDNHMTCVICRIPGREAELAICDRCVRPYHIFCLNPPLSSVPPTTYYCPSCTLVDGGSDFTEVIEEIMLWF